jgi:hypothetical protein
MRIIAVDAKHGGAAHDAGIWAVSRYRTYLQSQFEQGDDRSWILGEVFNEINLITKRVTNLF